MSLFPAYSQAKSDSDGNIEGTGPINNTNDVVVSDFPDSSGILSNGGTSSTTGHEDHSKDTAYESCPLDNEGFVIKSEFPEPTKEEGRKLFPAYSNITAGDSSSAPEADLKVWLNNESYTVLSQLPDSSSSSTSEPDSDSSPEDSNSKAIQPSKEKKRRKIEDQSVQQFPALPALDFDGSEQFYVDKKSERGYKRVDTLHRPACPMYRTFKALGQFTRPPKKKKDNFKRYFSKKSQKRFTKAHSKDDSAPTADNDEFLETNKLLNQATMQDVKNISAWIDLVQFQDKTPMKHIPKTQLAERKFDILNKALVHNPLSDALYTLYLDIANQVLPSFEVSKIVERLLGKDPTNYVLWRGLILATQGSMARCVVPDVLKLYERAMQQNYKKRRCDETMLKLFQSCAFFLRQAGLHEQLFALIKLALELNVNPDRFASVKPLESDQNLLIEFEEVVLSSGLPMNEIWLRVEKLRTNFYFLPCPSGFSCSSDPQRMVFNEDVCHFIYPLNGRENSMKLVFIILRLLKVPTPSGCGQREESEWDCMEDLLPVFYQHSFHDDSAFDAVLWDLLKELNMGPSYFASHIGHEVYTRTVGELLTLLASCFTGLEKMVLNLIWLRFERLLVVMARRDGKLTEEWKKRTRSRFKKFLKLEENRNEINYYVEYATLECEMGNREVAVGVLESSYNQGFGDSGLSNKDKFYICVTLVEMRMAENRFAEALKVLICLGMGSSIAGQDAEVLTEGKKLVALAALKKNLDNLSSIEVNVEAMEEEHAHLPDYLVNSIKCLVYMETLVKGKSQAISIIQDLRNTFANDQNPRHRFVQEKLVELRIAVKGLVLPKDPLKLSWQDFEEALMRFPHNLFVIKRLVNFKGLLWYKMKALALKTHSYATVIFLVASVRLWYKEAVQTDGESHVTMAHKYRVRSLLRAVVNDDEKLKKNAILWRLYLRILFELENSFDQCKNALFSALDECPWNKNLYLDGAIFVPHELTQIQDLIIEKQLRIYALPEELEILRTEIG